MHVNEWLRLIAGTFVLASVAASAASPWFLLLAAFVGVNQIQSAFSGWCPMMVVLRKAGVPD